MTTIWNYMNEDGKPMTKREIILDQVEYLAYAFVENNNGARPSEALIESWCDRLEMAYDTGTLTKQVEIE